MLCIINQRGASDQVATVICIQVSVYKGVCAGVTILHQWKIMCANNINANKFAVIHLGTSMLVHVLNLCMQRGM